MGNDHKRNVGPMLASPRCGALTRRGTACQSPRVTARKRCRMHGGALGSGAPRGNKNAFKHGTYSHEAVEQRLELRKQIEEVRELLRNVSHLTRGNIGNDN